MKASYTDEKNILILISLLKAHGIRKIVASPGTTNITFVRSLQSDSFFEIYSSVDERSAAYIACGLSAETGESVVLSCTGATASRNYMSGLTEAYYRKLPILSVTSTQEIARVGQHIAQVTDRSVLPKDVVKNSFHLGLVKDESDWLDCEIKANKAVLELRRHGGGPVHINLETSYSQNYPTKQLPNLRVLRRFFPGDILPKIPKGRIGIAVGSHKKMTDDQVKYLEDFCKCYDAAVFCDHTSGYQGEFSVIHSLFSSQEYLEKEKIKPDLTIHIGEITGDSSMGSVIGKKVWRVNEDGEIRDTFHRLEYIFEMTETAFFKYYSENSSNRSVKYITECRRLCNDIASQIPELPFSNLWIAQKIHTLIPVGSTIHFGILNSLRSWDFFNLPNNVNSNSNVGGFGIDGCMSSLVGASLANKNKLYFGVIGDLSFFYDLNSLGNRHVYSNLRILMINNGVGVEFKNYNNPASAFGDSANEYIAAYGHFGNRSRILVKNFAEALGFKYITASNKEEFENVYKYFVTEEKFDKPIVFEVFTNDTDESDALKIIKSIGSDMKGKAKSNIVNAVGLDNVRKIKKMLHK